MHLKVPHSLETPFLQDRLFLQDTAFCHLADCKKARPRQWMNFSNHPDQGIRRNHISLDYLYMMRHLYKSFVVRVLNYWTILVL